MLANCKTMYLFAEMLNSYFSSVGVFWINISDFTKILNSPVAIESTCSKKRNLGSLSHLNCVLPKWP